jgi:hypothetical protein
MAYSETFTWVWSGSPAGLEFNSTETAIWAGKLLMGSLFSALSTGLVQFGPWYAVLGGSCPGWGWVAEALTGFCLRGRFKVLK